MLPEGLRICREIILESFLKSPDEFLKVVNALRYRLDIDQKALLMICIQAAAEGSPEFRARILKHFTQ